MTRHLIDAHLHLWELERHLAHLEPDPAWLLRPDVTAGLAAVAEAGLVAPHDAPTGSAVPENALWSSRVRISPLQLTGRPHSR